MKTYMMQRCGGYSADRLLRLYGRLDEGQMVRQETNEYESGVQQETYNSQTSCPCTHITPVSQYVSLLYSYSSPYPDTYSVILVQ
jgi:hypothetical protein